MMGFTLPSFMTLSGEPRSAGFLHRLQPMTELFISYLYTFSKRLQFVLYHYSHFPSMRLVGFYLKTDHFLVGMLSYSLSN